MKVSKMLLFGSLLSLFALSGCSRSDAQEAIATPVIAGAFTSCREPRPEICYEVYAPVCATRDSGIRCVTTPCPSQEQAVYSNDCTACADSRVMGYVAVECR